MRLEGVAVAGVGMVRFDVHRGRSYAELAREAGLAALRDAGIGFGDVGEAWVGIMQAPPMQPVRLMKELGLTGLPVTHVQSASATGLVAFREAAWAVASGRAEVALALGVEKMSELAAAGQRGRGVGRDEIDGVILPAAYFALWATRRMHERGTRPEHFARIAAKNWNAGARNPLAQRRADHVVTPEEVLRSAPLADPLTAMMACPVSDGAACAVVTTVERARALRPGRAVVAPRSSALQSERYTPGHTFLGPVVGPASMTRDTARQAYDEAGVGPEDVSLALVHDAFANEELEYYELLGFCAEGDAEKLVEDGATDLGGRIPVSTDGGLLARGHPGGPTGLAQIHELTLQLRGEAGPRQLPGARVGLAHLVGGGSVCNVTLLERLA
ncbi:MAG TPA: thiolase family protein [Myxococcota bacterium]|nr:thiolase family protein [Myxococcota bacterium]